MRRLTALLYGVTGQTLTVRIPQGRPTSATYAVYRNFGSDEATPEWSGSATVNTVDTTASAAAGPTQTDPQSITLVSTTGIVAGVRYLLAQNQVSEWIDPVDVSSTRVRARTPLQHDYSSGATFKGCSLTASVDSTWIANLANLSDLADTCPDYRVKWTAIVNGSTIVTYTFFDVVRSDVRHHVDLADVGERAFGLADTLPIEFREEAGRPIIDGAWRAVRAHLLAQGISPDSWRDDEALDELVVLRSLRHLAEGGWHPSGTELSDWRTTVTNNYDRFFEQHLVTLKHKTSVDLDSMTNPYAPAPARAIWSK